MEEQEQERRDQIRRAVAQLAQSDRGRRAMRDLLAMLDNGGTALDEFNKAAVLALIEATFDGYVMAVPDAIREVLHDPTLTA